MQYHFDIYKIIGVFLGKMNWEHREAVEWLWSLNIPIQRSVFAGVRTVALGDGGWGPGECVSHTEWTLGVCTDGPVDTCASGQSMRAREQEGSGLWAAFLSTSSYSAEVFSQGAEERERRLWAEPPVQPEGGLSSLLEARQLVNSQLVRCFPAKVDTYRF